MVDNLVSGPPVFTACAKFRFWATAGGSDGSFRDQKNLIAPKNDRDRAAVRPS
jgi:hypothetical protein